MLDPYYKDDYVTIYHGDDDLGGVDEQALLGSI